MIDRFSFVQFGSDYDRDDSAALSNATTDDEMFDRMMRVPLNLPTFLSESTKI